MNRARMITRVAATQRAMWFSVRWQNWKLFLNPRLTLYDLAQDPGESQPVRNRAVARKLRGMAVLFQEEMRLDARPAGQASPPPAP